MSILRTLTKKMGGQLTGEKFDERRNTFYVEKEFQHSFILFFLVIVTFMILVSGGACYLFLHRDLEQSMYTVHPKVTNIRAAMTTSFILYFIEVTVIAFLIIVITVDRILQRITKSLMTYERLAESLAKLDFKKARTIETDRFSNLHKQYNDLIDKCSTDIMVLKEKVTRITLLISYLGENRDASKENKIATLMELIKLKGAVEEKLREYDLDDMTKRK